jgi:hypothetical protein
LEPLAKPKNPSISGPVTRLDHAASMAIGNRDTNAANARELGQVGPGEDERNERAAPALAYRAATLNGRRNLRARERFAVSAAANRHFSIWQAVRAAEGYAALSLPRDHQPQVRSTRVGLRIA